MGRRSIELLLLALFSSITIAAAAQARLIVTINPPVIGQNETAELKLVVQNARSVEKITPPSLKDFTIISGPGQEQGVETINGVTRQYVGITYLLQPKAKGTFTIGPATASAAGRVLKSYPVKLTVQSSPTGSSPNSPFSSLLQEYEPRQQANYNDLVLKKGENVQDKISKNLFIIAQADKTSCYTGEPVVVTYKLYTRLDVTSALSKHPSFNGFSVIDLLPQQPVNYYSVEKLNGREYNACVLRKVQLYPLQPGAAVLDAAEVENMVRFVKEDYLQKSAVDPFGEFTPGLLPADALQTEKVTIQSKPVLITVKPLPETGKPASFSGAVGNFTLEAAAEKDSLTTDDAGTLTLLLSGKGNLTLVPAPAIDWPAGMEGYEPAVKDATNSLLVPVSGSMIFNYPFNINKPGTYHIPAVEFSYFDPSEGRYKTVNSKPVTVHVTKGAGKKMAPVADNHRSPKSFFDILFTNRWMIFLPVAFLIICGLLVWLKADRKEQIKLTAAAAQKIAEQQKAEKEALMKDPLLRSEALLVHNDARSFYETLNKELHIFLGNKLGIAPEAISKKSIADGLDRSGIAVGDSMAILQLLEDIAAQLYSPFADESKMQDLFAEAVRLVKKV